MTIRQRLYWIKDYFSLFAENRRLRSELRYLSSVIEGDIDRDAMIRHFTYDTDFRVTIPKPMALVLAEMFAVVLDESESFFTTELNIRARGYEMTIRRSDGITPAEKIRELREENARLRATQKENEV